MSSELGTGDGTRFPAKLSPVMEGVLLPTLVGDFMVVKADRWCSPVIRELTRLGGNEGRGEWGALYWKESELARVVNVQLSCGDTDNEEDKCI